jgi:hypothetical protein
LNHAEKRAREHVAEAQRLIDGVLERLRSRELDWGLLMKLAREAIDATRERLGNDDEGEDDPGDSPGGRFQDH